MWLVRLQSVLPNQRRLFLGKGECQSINAKATSCGGFPHSPLLYSELRLSSCLLRFTLISLLKTRLVLHQQCYPVRVDGAISRDRWISEYQCKSNIMLRIFSSGPFIPRAPPVNLPPSFHPHQSSCFPLLIKCCPISAEMRLILPVLEEKNFCQIRQG